MRQFLSLLLATLATAKTTFQPEIRADTNRDGHVDVDGDTDAHDKDVWTSARGAIFLPNIGDSSGRCYRADARGNPLSNKEISACNDASGHLLLEEKYVTPLRTMPMPDLPDDAYAHVFATPKAAYDRVRLFVKNEDYDLVDRDLKFNATRLRAGLELALDGRELVTDSNVWDGNVLVHFEVSSGNSSSTDVVAMKMAPVLTHHHLQKVETLVSVAGNDTTPYQQTFLSDLEAARQKAGIEQPLFLFNQSDDVWAQDFFEPAYTSMPGPEGPISIRIMLRSAESTRVAGRQVFEQLRGPGIGGFQPSEGFGDRDINSYGNLETIPPHIAKDGTKYPAGRIITGKHFSEYPAEVMLKFYHAQSLQKPLILETGFLMIGHVDEFVQFLPFDNDLGWTIGIADTKTGLKTLRDLEAAGHGNTKAISFIPPAGSKDLLAVLGTDDFNKTVSQVLKDKAFLEANDYAQKHIDANLQLLLEEIDLSTEDIIHVPALFREPSSRGMSDMGSDDGLPDLFSPEVPGEKKLISFLPGSSNGIVIGKHYLCPKPWGPKVNGTDMVEKAIEKAYGRAGMDVTYVEDFMSHHVYAGEIHCGSNTFRETDVAWWE